MSHVGVQRFDPRDCQDHRPENDEPAESVANKKLHSVNWIHRRFFFESSMLIALGIMGAVVIDVPITARYGLEKSNLRVSRALFEFPILMSLGLIRRMWFQKILYSLTVEALLAIFGFLFFLAVVLLMLPKFLMQIST